MRKCAICGHRKAISQDNPLFRIPLNSNKVEEWSNAAGHPFRPNQYVCAIHFEEKFVSNFLDENGKIYKTCLTRDAIPTLNLGNSSKICAAERPPIKQYVNQRKIKCNKSISEAVTPSFELQLPSPIIPIPSVPITENCSCPEDFNSSQDSFFYCNVIEAISTGNLLLPLNWGTHKTATSIIISHIDDNLVPKVDKAIVIGLESIQVFINGISRPFSNPTDVSSLIDLITSLEKITPCKGTGIKNRFSRFCNGENTRSKTVRCSTCGSLRKSIMKRQKTKVTLRKQNWCKTKAIQLTNMRVPMVNKMDLNQIISKLPENQQLVVQTCLETVGQSSTRKRYSKEWIYTSILLRIKSPKLYRHLRSRNLLPLPAPCTISRYIRNVDSSYGFQQRLFHLIKEKTKSIPITERHGTLMIDECKVTASKHFDKNRLEVLGFVDLGQHTPSANKDELGDHALVFMFQPFAGRNMQALGCFLSKGNVTGVVQAKLVLECVCLCEANGLFIDVVTSDGATWNRAMWKNLGAGNANSPWCNHPCDEKRKLRMCSDFPHLLKCLRNRLVSQKEFHVPEGPVKLRHFELLIAYDAKHEFKLAPKLTSKHVNPQYHEKMTTRYAFQLFSGTVADALSILKAKDLPDFIDCDATIQFCRRINEISDVLNSGDCLHGLRSGSPQQAALENFLVYLDLWESCAPSQFYLTKSTSDGFKATINTTLDLLQYCIRDLRFEYLMTSRINQDPLEHFFGLLRQGGGANNNAETMQIAQIFRLMSLYSLVKPPRGSNVTGGNMLEALVSDSTADLLAPTNIKDDSILTKQRIDLYLDQVIDGNLESGDECMHFQDNDEAFAYVCGYIARKHKTEKCQACVQTLIGDGFESYNTFIALRSRGHLIFPSMALVVLLKNVESNIAAFLKIEVKRNTLFHILEKLTQTRICNFVGCTEHRSELTKKVIFSFLITRMFFACQKEAKKRSYENSNSKKLAKLAKLV